MNWRALGELFAVLGGLQQTSSRWWDGVSPRGSAWGLDGVAVSISCAKSPLKKSPIKDWDAMVTPPVEGLESH